MEARPDVTSEGRVYSYEPCAKCGAEVGDAHLRTVSATESEWTCPPRPTGPDRPSSLRGGVIAGRVQSEHVPRTYCQFGVQQPCGHEDCQRQQVQRVTARTPS